MCEWGILENNLRIEEQEKRDKSILYKISPKIYEILNDIEMSFYVWRHPYSVYAIPKRS